MVYIEIKKTSVTQLVSGQGLLNLSSLTNATEKRSDVNNKLGVKNTSDCISPAIFEFPSDGFTSEERRHGWILLHIFVVLYCFWLLAAICDDYLVPAIEQCSATLQMQKDVVGATFMAAATSCPELFINCVGTFVTRGDIGVGTIVGSAVFNILAVPACCGIFVWQRSQLDWWPITRDCLMYCAAVVALIGTIYDDRIMWYEALLLVMGYFIYMMVMYYNDKMARTARKIISKYRHRKCYARSYREVSEFTPLIVNNNNDDIKDVTDPEAYQSSLSNSVNSLRSNDSDTVDSPWQRGGRRMHEFILRWPITFFLWLTIPNSREHPSLRYLTFLLSVCWIGAISYLVAFVITILGDTLTISDSVMGLTVLAAGMSVPEAISSIIVTRQGQSAMGISNSIGSNTFDILLCLGLPWFIKAYFLPENTDQLWVTLNSTGIIYSAVFLLTTLFGLYAAFVTNKFILDWKVGVACTVMYVTFLVIASMIELNVFFPVNLPVCKH